MKKLFIAVLAFLCAAGAVWALDPMAPGAVNTPTNFAINDETPDVSGGAYVFATANAATPTTITQFDGLTAGQSFLLRIGDASTTIDFTQANLIGNNETSYSATSGDVLHCYSYDGTVAACWISDPTAWHAADGDLTDIAALTPTDCNIMVGDGTDWVAESGATARTSLGAEGTLTNEAGLYSALSDVTDFVQTSEIDTTAELESVANAGAYASDLLDLASLQALWELITDSDGAADRRLRDDGDDTYSWVDYHDLPALSSAPGTPVDGAIYKADNEDGGWNPVASVTGDVDYWVIYDGASYIALWDDDGNLLVSSITGVQIDLDDDTSLEIEGGADEMDDDEYNGVTVGGLDAGEAIGQWDVVFIKNDTDPIWEADATAASGEYPAFGIAVAAASDTNPVTILTQGVVRNEGWTGQTIGGAVYLGESDGALTQTAPSDANDCVQIIGWAISDSEIYFDFSRPYQLVE